MTPLEPILAKHVYFSVASFTRLQEYYPNIDDAGIAKLFEHSIELPSHYVQGISGYGGQVPLRHASRYFVLPDFVSIFVLLPNHPSYRRSSVSDTQSKIELEWLARNPWYCVTLQNVGETQKKLLRKLFIELGLAFKPRTWKGPDARR
jgi:hypothetical protein